jgi:sugar phosphate isomerase/epimerase
LADFMKFAICHELFENWSWKDQCSEIAQAGYTGIEFAPFTLGQPISAVSAEERREIRQIAAGAGLEVLGLHWLLAKTTGFHLTTADKAVRQKTADYVVELARLCADLGGTIMVFGSPAQRSLQPGVTWDRAFAHAVEVFRSAMPAVGDLGVTICMEPLTPKETDFLNTCGEATALIWAVDHPNFQLHQDVKAMLGGETTPIPALIDRYENVTKHFHVNDSNLLGPGMGETDYVPILKALQDSGYDGWVSVEVFDYKPGAQKIAKDSIEYLKATLKKIG